MAELFHDTDENTRRFSRDRLSFTSFKDYNEALHKTSTVYVGNLCIATKEAEIQAVFSKVGTVKRVVMGLDKTRAPSGFCFVEYWTHSEALDAVNYLNGSVLHERIMRVDIDPGFREGRQFARGSKAGQPKGDQATAQEDEKKAKADAMETAKALAQAGFSKSAQAFEAVLEKFQKMMEEKDKSPPPPESFSVESSVSPIPKAKKLEYTKGYNSASQKKKNKGGGAGRGAGAGATKGQDWKRFHLEQELLEKTKQAGLSWFPPPPPPAVPFAPVFPALPPPGLFSPRGPFSPLKGPPPFSPVQGFGSPGKGPFSPSQMAPYGPPVVPFSLSKGAASPLKGPVAVKSAPSKETPIPVQEAGESEGKDVGDATATDVEVTPVAVEMSEESEPKADVIPVAEVVAARSPPPLSIPADTPAKTSHSWGSPFTSPAVHTAQQPPPSNAAAAKATIPPFSPLDYKFARPPLAFFPWQGGLLPFNPLLFQRPATGLFYGLPPPVIPDPSLFVGAANQLQTGMYKDRQACKFFSVGGNCKFGDKCIFRHDVVNPVKEQKSKKAEKKKKDQNSTQVKQVQTAEQKNPTGKNRAKAAAAANVQPMVGEAKAPTGKGKGKASSAVKSEAAGQEKKTKDSAPKKKNKEKASTELNTAPEQPSSKKSDSKEGKETKVPEQGKSVPESQGKKKVQPQKKKEPAKAPNKPAQIYVPVRKEPPAVIAQEQDPAPIQEVKSA